MNQEEIIKNESTPLGLSEIKFSKNRVIIEVMVMENMGVTHGDLEKQEWWIKNYSDDYRKIVKEIFDDNSNKYRELLLSDDKNKWKEVAKHVEEKFKVHV